MKKQTKIQKIALMVIGAVAVTLLGASAIVRNYSTKTKYVSGMSLRDIVESRKTWDTAYTSWYGEQAPDFTVEDIEGKTHKLADYLGRDVLIVFWATWCPACNMEIPHLIELRKMLGEDKLVVLAISNESPERLKQFAASKNINYAVASIDISLLPAPFIGVASIPTTFIVDRNGKIKLAVEGLVSLEEIKVIMQAG